MTMTPNTAAPVWSDAAQLVNNLSHELGSFEWTAADSVCSKLIDRLNNSVEPFPEDPAKQILSRLRRKRQFRMMELVADALIRSGQSSPQVRASVRPSDDRPGQPDFRGNGFEFAANGY